MTDKRIPLDWPEATEEEMAKLLARIVEACTPEEADRATEWGEELDETGESESFDKPVAAIHRASS